ncbi:MAG: hypothetical protein ACREEM_19910, partial [Blastocatellia bacterium]
MESLEHFTQHLDAFDRQLSRRAFFWRAAVGGAMVRGGLAAGDREFLDAVAKTLIPADALRRSDVDV